MSLKSQDITVGDIIVHIKKSECEILDEDGQIIPQEQPITWNDLTFVQANVSVVDKRDETKRLPIEGYINHESMEKLKNSHTVEEEEKVQQQTVTQQKIVTQQQTVTSNNDSFKMPTRDSFRSREIGVGGMSSEIDFCIKNLLNAKLRANNRLGKFLQVNGGMLLHGPPGSGKSYLARAVGKVWQKADPSLKIRFVRGPELFNQFVGKTEESVRELFSEAEENITANKADSDTPLVQHLVIIDEIDSMFGSRGIDSTSPAADRATAMFISMMDDLDLRTNLFVIGTTNRFDLCDPAVIRPGRLGLHLEIAAMDTDDKVDVLRLYLEELEEQDMSEEQKNEERVSSQNAEQIVDCFRQRFSSMTTSMIRDAIGRAVVEQEAQDAHQMTVEHFAQACQSILNDKVDYQSRFRKLVDCQKNTKLPSVLYNAVVQTVTMLNKPGQIAVAITGSDIWSRTKVALRAYEESSSMFDKVWYFCPAQFATSAPNRRIYMLQEEILRSFHYKTEKKLLIIDQVELFVGNDADLHAMKLILANVCTPEGHIMLGYENQECGSLQVILGQDESWTQRLSSMGAPLANVNLSADSGAANRKTNPAVSFSLCY